MGVVWAPCIGCQYRRLIWVLYGLLVLVANIGGLYGDVWALYIGSFYGPCP